MRANAFDNPGNYFVPRARSACFPSYFVILFGHVSVSHGKFPPAKPQFLITHQKMIELYVMVLLSEAAVFIMQRETKSGIILFILRKSKSRVDHVLIELCKWKSLAGLP